MGSVSRPKSSAFEPLGSKHGGLETAATHESMGKVLSQQQVESYRDDGVVFPARILSDTERTRYLGLYLELEERMKDRARPNQLAMAHLYYDWAYELVTHPRILDLVEDVLGPDVVIWSASFFTKPPHDPGYVSWHQDATYWGLDLSEVTTAWLALSDSTVENGCMRMVSGSHTQPILSHLETHAEDNLLSRGQVVEVEVDESEAVDVILKAGEASLHHVNIIHGSNANSSNSSRIGFAIRMVTPRVKQTGYQFPAILGRGSDPYHHYEYAKKPTHGNSEEAMATHIAAYRKIAEMVSSTPAG